MTCAFSILPGRRDKAIESPPLLLVTRCREGGAVAEVLCRLAPAPVEMVGVNDTFGESGEPDEILSKCGLTSEAIVDAALRAVSRKGSAG